jgi:hypothetical protein
MTADLKTAIETAIISTPLGPLSLEQYVSAATWQVERAIPEA